MPNNTLEGPPSLQPLEAESQIQPSLSERIRGKIDSAKAWVHDQLHPSTQAEFEAETGDALTFVAERTINEVDMHGPRDAEGEQQIVESVGAAAEQTIDGGLAGRPKNPIEVLETDGHDEELVDATVAIAAEDTSLAEQIAVEIDRVEAAANHPQVAEREVQEAKKQKLKETTATSAEVFTTGIPEGLSKDERKAFLDRPESWDAERRQVHEKIVDQAMARARELSRRLQERNPKPTIYALRGNTASGKTRALGAGHEMFAGILDENGEPSGAINPDTFKHELRGGEQEISAYQVHDEGSMIGRRVERQLASPDMSVVMDKRNETPGDVQDIIDNAKETGRAVRILDVDVPLETSLVGVLMRSRGGEDPNVPFGAIKAGFVGIRAHRSELVKEVEANADGVVDGYMFMAFDPSERKSVPVATMIDGKVVVDERKRDIYEACFATAEKADAAADEVGDTLIDDAYIERYCSTYFEDTESGQAYAASVAAKLGQFKGKTLKRAVDIMADTDPAADRRDYLDQAHRVLLATSRTANGEVDTSASSTKAESMVAIDGDEAAEKAQANFDKAVELAFDQRDRDFSSAGDVKQFVESIAAQVNEGIVNEGSLIRSGEDSTKFPYRRLAELPAAMEQFYSELQEKLADPESDPVEVAAFAEYHIDLVDHAFSDGCGKTAKAVSSFVLARAGLPLPSYEGGRDNYYAHAPRNIPGADPATDEAAWQNFLSYYKGMM